MKVGGRFVGIDPGITGAIAALPEAQGGVPVFWDTPTLKLKVGKAYKSQMDVAQCKAILEDLKNNWPWIHVVLEKVVPMPSIHDGARMGSSSAFNFGKGVGIWIGLMAALEIPFEEVHPATWKKAMMPGMSKEKGASILRATQLFPGATRDLLRKKDHGRAEALLLAEYGRRMYNPNSPEVMTRKDLSEIVNML